MLPANTTRYVIQKSLQGPTERLSVTYEELDKALSTYSTLSVILPRKQLQKRLYDHHISEQLEVRSLYII